MVGSIKRLQLSPAEIVARYLAGEGAGFLGLRAKVPAYRITEILLAAGVRIRGPHEALRLAMPERSERIARRARRQAA